MPDLPELYEALDDALDDMIHPPSPNYGSYSKYGNVAGVILALCAAIEVKQTQEFHELMNRDRYSESVVRILDAVQLYYDWTSEYEELPVRLQQVLDAYKDFRAETKSQLREYTSKDATWSRASAPEEMWDKMDEETTATETQGENNVTE